jgi:hypothetical protein
MNSTPFEALPGRVFLDTCIVNLILDYGEQIHEGAAIEETVPPRMREDIEALRDIFATGQRAFWQLAISPLTYREVTVTKEPSRAYNLQRWFFDIWHYWRSFLHSAKDLPSFSEAEETRLRLLSSGVLDVLPDMADRVLLCDAVVYNCDAFCTRDWSTILRHREALRKLPLKIVRPSEWWAEIRPWAPLWV